MNKNVIKVNENFPKVIVNMLEQTNELYVDHLRDELNYKLELTDFSFSLINNAEDEWLIDTIVIDDDFISEIGSEFIETAKECMKKYFESDFVDSLNYKFIVSGKNEFDIIVKNSAGVLLEDIDSEEIQKVLIEKKH